eukprot:355166-Chlamydomonas_euryale.AAC.6
MLAEFLEQHGPPQADPALTGPPQLRQPAQPPRASCRRRRRWRRHHRGSRPAAAAQTQPAAAPARTARRAAAAASRRQLPPPQALRAAQRGVRLRPPAGVCPRHRTRNGRARAARGRPPRPPPVRPTRWPAPTHTALQSRRRRRGCPRARRSEAAA